MKFGDKLISLRKKHGLSQEELASKLNVSRQSVSKWESNNTYPETDKIVQICNIFDCRMDDLINDKISDVDSCERKNKNNFSIAFDSLLEFITKSINMFTSMKFSSGLRCLVEFGILAGCLILLGTIITETGTDIIMNLFGFLSEDIYWIFNNIIYTIFEIVVVCFSVIIIIHVFKIRYLDFYDKMVLENKSEGTIDEVKKKEKNDEKCEEKEEQPTKRKLKFKLNEEPKIIIRDKHTTFAFLSTVSKIIIGVFKAMVALLACCFVFSLVCLIALVVVSISLSKFSLMFIGIDIGLLGIIVINILILLMMINYVINKKSNLKLMSYVFLGSLITIGVGCGLGLIGVAGFKFIDSMEGISEPITKEVELDVKENMVIDTYDTDGYTITIDDTMDDKTIKVIGSLDQKYFSKVNVWADKEYGMNVYSVHNSTKLDFDVLIDLIYDDLENKIIRSYYVEDGTIEVVCNSKVARMLLDNAKKIYLVDETKTDTGYKIGHYRQKIYLNYNCEMEYDARTGEYSYDNACVCEKENRMSPDGEIVDFDCYYKVDSEE